MPEQHPTEEHARSQEGVPFQWPADDLFVEPEPEDGEEPAYDRDSHDPDAEPEDHP